MSSAHGNELQDLKRQMAGLQDGVLPRVGKLTDSMRPRLERLMTYVETAAEYAPQASVVLERLMKRGEAGTGLLGRLYRHRVVVTGVVIGAGLLAYDLWSEKLNAAAAGSKER